MKFKFYAIKTCIFLILVFLIQTLILNFTEVFILNELAKVEVWRFISSIFLHASLAHLIYNMFALALFGSILESLVGGRRFLVVFFLTGILANIVSVNFYSNSLGASGAIFGVIGALIIVRPLLIVWAFGMPMPIFLAGILWAAGDLLGAIGFLTGNPVNNTGNIAHLSGMFFGFIFGFLFRKKSSKKGSAKTSIDESEARQWEDRHFR